MCMCEYMCKIASKETQSRIETNFVLCRIQSVDHDSLKAKVMGSLSTDSNG